MRKSSATDAELRRLYSPSRTWVALSAIGGMMTVIRNALYGIPVMPVRTGLTPLIVCTLLGAAYFAAIETWLIVRKWNGT